MNEQLEKKKKRNLRKNISLGFYSHKRIIQKMNIHQRYCSLILSRLEYL